MSGLRGKETERMIILILIISVAGLAIVGIVSYHHGYKSVLDKNKAIEKACFKSHYQKYGKRK